MLINLQHISIAILFIQFLLAALAWFSHSKEGLTHLQSHRRSLLVYYLFTILYLIYQSVRLKMGKAEIMSEYDIAIIMVGSLLPFFYADAIMGNQWYRLHHIWIICLGPILFMVAVRWYFDQYQDVHTCYDSWEDLWRKWTMRSPVLFIRAGFMLCMLYLLHLEASVFHSYHRYEEERRRNHQPSPSWIRQHLSVNFTLTIALLAGCLTPHPLYHLILILLIPVTSLYMNWKLYREPLGPEAKDSSFSMEKKDSDDYVQLLQLDKAIQLLSQTTPFPLAKPSLTPLDVALMLNVHQDNFEYYLEHVKEMTFPAWIYRMKMEYCSHQLKHTHLPLLHISQAAGYHDLSTMSKAFKRYYGINPSEYRRENRNKEK